jgi:hypothetical protein
VIHPINQAMSAQSLRRLNALEELLQFSRSLVPVLKDANREHSASDLEARVFAIDADHEEIQKLLENAAPEDYLAAMAEFRERLKR